MPDLENAERIEPHPKIPWVRLKIWCPAPLFRLRCRNFFFFSTPLGWEPRFWTKTHQAPARSSILEPSKTGFSLQPGAVPSKSGTPAGEVLQKKKVATPQANGGPFGAILAVAAVWCALFGGVFCPPPWGGGFGRLLGANLGSTWASIGAEDRKEDREEDRQEDRQEDTQEDTQTKKNNYITTPSGVL